VANFVCGILLLFERPIRVGDIVTLGDTTGTVIRIRSRATTVRNWDRQEVVIPNKELITGRIINWTLTDSINRIAIQVGIAYGSDTNRAGELLRQIAQENENVLDDPKPVVTFEEFGDSSLTFMLRAFLAQVEDRLSTIHALHTRIKQRFEEEGIEIAFPQRDLHIRSVDPSVPSGSLPSKPTVLRSSRRSAAPVPQQPSKP
jgi:potassium efflux system protein